MFAQQQVVMQGATVPAANYSYLPPAVQTVSGVQTPSVQTMTPAPVANTTASIFSKATSAAEAYAAYAAQSQNSYIPAAQGYVSAPSAPSAYVSPAPAVVETFTQAPAFATATTTEYVTAPSTYVSPAPAVVETFTQAPAFATTEYVTAPSTYLSPAPAVVETFTQAPAVEYVSSAPTVEYVTSAPTYVGAPPVVAPTVEYVTSAPTVEYVAPTPAVEYVSAPAVSYAAPTMAVQAPVAQVASYLPAPMAMETIVQAPSYIPAPPAMFSQQVVSAPNVASFIPPAQVPFAVEQFAPAVGFDYAGGQSVIVEQIGDWLVCEDAMGLFFHHGPTQQSFDNAPTEFLMLFPQGYAPPPLGAFSASGMALQGAPIVVEQFAAPGVAYANPVGTVAVGSYMPPVGTYSAMAPMVEIAGTTPFVGGGFPAQLPPVMAKVLN